MLYTGLSEATCCSTFTENKHIIIYKIIYRYNKTIYNDMYYIPTRANQRGSVNHNIYQLIIGTLYLDNDKNRLHYNKVFNHVYLHVML